MSCHWGPPPGTFQHGRSLIPLSRGGLRAVVRTGSVHTQARAGAQRLSEAGPTCGERQAAEEELSLKDPRGVLQGEGGAGSPWMRPLHKCLPISPQALHVCSWRLLIKAKNGAFHYPHGHPSSERPNRAVLVEIFMGHVLKITSKLNLC